MSLDKFRTKFAGRTGEEYALHSRPMARDGYRRLLPLYMAFCL
ncbi:hypothetical protein BBSC_2310 [Bifidobacterium scardovii JCM 12489 = DSM 13734]|nr:hypothetical protein BBSC_2310 [Bifidobacterium scardovii JCM 12489 = DSM 13734]